MQKLLPTPSAVFDKHSIVLTTTTGETATFASDDTARFLSQLATFTGNKKVKLVIKTPNVPEYLLASLSKKKLYVDTDDKVSLGYLLKNPRLLNFIDIFFGEETADFAKINAISELKFNANFSENDTAPTKVLYELGSGIGNIITATPTITLLSKAAGTPIDIYVPNGIQLWPIFANSPYVSKFYSDERNLTGRSFQVYIKSAIANVVHPSIRADRILDLASLQSYNVEGRFTHETLFHFLPVRNWLGLDLPEAKHFEITAPRIFTKKTASPSPEKICTISHGKQTQPWDKRSWPYMEKLVSSLGTEWKVVSLGSKGEHVAGTIDKTGLSLEESIAELQNSTVFVGPDGGLCHIAEALDIPAVWLFGPSCVTKNGPVKTNQKSLTGKVSCSPCIYNTDWNDCKKNNCMEQILISEVTKAIGDVTSTSTDGVTPNFSVYEWELENHQAPWKLDNIKVNPNTFELNELDSLNLVESCLRNSDLLGLLTLLTLGAVKLNKKIERNTISVLNKSIGRTAEGTSEIELLDALSVIEGRHGPQSRELLSAAKVVALICSEARMQSKKIDDKLDLIFGILKKEPAIEKPKSRRTGAKRIALSGTQALREISFLKNSALPNSFKMPSPFYSGKTADLIKTSTLVLVRNKQKHVERRYSWDKQLATLLTSHLGPFCPVILRVNLQNDYDDPKVTFEKTNVFSVTCAPDFIGTIVSQLKECNFLTDSTSLYGAFAETNPKYQKLFHIEPIEGQSDSHITMVEMFLYLYGFSDQLTNWARTSNGPNAVDNVNGVVSLEGELLANFSQVSKLVLANPFLMFICPDIVGRHINAKNIFSASENKYQKIVPDKRLIFVNDSLTDTFHYGEARVDQPDTTIVSSRKPLNSIEEIGPKLKIASADFVTLNNLIKQTNRRTNYY